MSARPGVSPAVTPEKRGSAAAVPPPRRVQNSCYENLIDGMCCQLPGKISRPPLTKRKNGKEQGSSGRPGCAGSGASAGSRKKVPAVRKIHRQEPGFGQHAGTLPGPWRTAGNAAGQREQECTPGPHRKPGGKTLREAGGLVFIRQAQGRRKGSLSIRGNSCGLPSVARRQDRPNLKKLAAPGG